MAYGKLLAELEGASSMSGSGDSIASPAKLLYIGDQSYSVSRLFLSYFEVPRLLDARQPGQLGWENTQGLL